MSNNISIFAEISKVRLLAAKKTVFFFRKPTSSNISAPLKKTLFCNTTLNSHFFRCGGSLVSRRHVVTAGHCVARASPKQVHVTLGDYVINSAVEPLPAYTFGVSQIQVNQPWQKPKVKGDSLISTTTTTTTNQFGLLSLCVSMDTFN